MWRSIGARKSCSVSRARAKQPRPLVEARTTVVPSSFPERTIADLPAAIAALPEGNRALLDTLFEVVEEEGEIVPPPEMVPWLERTFGSLETIRRQRIVRVMNRWTYEGACFNPLRAHRPGAGANGLDPERLASVRARIEGARGDDFCDPEHRTPADAFGRVYGRQSRSAANVARADGWHGVVIFDEHDPLAVDGAALADALGVARAWAARAHAADPAARHFFLLWNCLWRAGASVVHAHLQMTLGRGMAHAGVERWRAAAQRYFYATGRAYFADLAAAHRALGLGARWGAVEVFASLTPVKERELVLLAPVEAWTDRANGSGSDAAEAALAEGLAKLIAVYRRMGVLALNLAIFGRPLGNGAGWEGFPTVARLTDRGDPLSTTADVAALELFGSSVVAADPFAVAREAGLIR
jgi:hypothetical protein